MKRLSLSLFVLLAFVLPSQGQIWLRQSTTSQEVPLGTFVDSIDGDTAETGLTIANTDIKLHKTGATTLANKNSGGATHMNGGNYYCVLDATDTDTLGPMTIFCHPTGALAIRVECLVLSANVFDSLQAGSDKLEVDVAQISSDATAADNAESFFDGTGYGPLLLRSGISTVTSQTRLTLNVSNLTDALIGSRIIVRRPSTRAAFTGVVTSTQTGEEVLFAVDGTAAFNIVGTDIVEILPASFGRSDRELIDTEVAIIKGKTDSLTFTVANEVNANTRYWLGTACATPTVPGVPEVDITKVLGTDASAVSGAIDVNVVKLIGNEIELTPP